MITRELLIEAGRTDRQYWCDLWRYRELFYFLAWRDIAVRYKQTTIGVAWALVRPALTTIIFTFVFSRLANLPDSGVPYPLLVFAAMLPWQFFATALAECSNSLTANSNLVCKVYFPRLIIPASSVATSSVDFSLSLLLFGGLMLWYGVMPDWRAAFLPLLAVLTFAASLGLGLWLAALNVRYRDFRYIVPFLVQLGLYLSPVGFQSTLVPEPWRLVYSLNPMVGVIDAFRWSLLGGAMPFHWSSFLCALATVACFLAGGVWYFRRTERSFADHI
jgi:lipopolysaccharide transport system permease protein